MASVKALEEELAALNKQLASAMKELPSYKATIDMVVVEWEHVLARCLVQEDFAKIRKALEDHIRILTSKVVPFIQKVRQNSESCAKHMGLVVRDEMGSDDLRLVGRKILRGGY